MYYKYQPHSKLEQDNLISQSKQTWIGICQINPKFGIEDFIPNNKTFHWISNFNPNDVYHEITNIIQNINGNN